jgi:glycine/serine hydroxymethyltransferase
MIYIATTIDAAIKNKDNPNILGELRQNISDMCKKFPIYT